MLCAPQEAVPVFSYQCAFSKFGADATFGAESDGCTPLHISVRVEGDGIFERVQTLLQAALDLDMMTDARGCTPLHSSVLWLSTAAVLMDILHIRPIFMSI